MRDECLGLAVLPTDSAGASLQHGALLDDGEFFRNQEDARNRFGHDPPDLGYTLDPAAHKWNWYEGEERGGLSVNKVSCVCSRRCSAALHPTPDRFKWVVRIRLKELSKALSVQLVAKYRPIDEDGEKNPCHFELLPDSSSIDEMVLQIKSALKRLLSLKNTKDSAEIARQREHVQWVESFMRVERIDPSNEFEALAQASKQASATNNPPAGPEAGA